MPVYMIVEIKKVTDKKKYAEYVRKVPQTVKKFAGTYLARSNEIKAVSGKWKPARLIIIKFPSMAEFKAWWNSPVYRSIVPLRETSAETNAIVVEGV